MWARGRGNGWGQNGELQFFIKDRSRPEQLLPVSHAGELRVRRARRGSRRFACAFEKFFALRAKLESAYLRGSSDSLSCSGADSALIARSGLPIGSAVNRFAACDGGYMVYTTDPAVAPPNLGSVQELAVGIVRVDSATGPTPITPSDTLEVWVDDIRLADVVSETGFAGQIGLSMALGDLATFRISATRRDPNFRQLGEAPSFATNNDLELATTVRLDQFLPPTLGLALPLTIVIHDGDGRPDVPRAVGCRRRRDRRASARRARRPRATRCPCDASQPLSGPWYAPIVNHLGVTGTYLHVRQPLRVPGRAAATGSLCRRLLRDAAGRGSEPGTATARGSARAHAGLAVDDRGRRRASFNLRPTSFRVTSGLARDSERRESFLKPAGAADDPGEWRRARAICGGTRRRSSSSRCRTSPRAPTSSCSATCATTTRRRLTGRRPTPIAGRSSGWTPASSASASSASSITYAPEIAGWLRPRVDLASSFSLLRDPNAPLVFPTSLGLTPASDTSRRELAAAARKHANHHASARVSMSRRPGRKYAARHRRSRRVCPVHPADRRVRHAGDPQLVRRGVRRAGSRVSARYRNDHRIPRARTADSRTAPAPARSLSLSSGLNLPLGLHVHESRAADDDAELGATARVGSDDDRRRPDRVSRPQRAMEPARPVVRWPGEGGRHSTDGCCTRGSRWWSRRWSAGA